MKHVMLVIFVSLVAYAFPATGKTGIEVFQQNNANGSSIIGFKELREDGDALGFVFVCPKDEDEARVVLILPRTEGGEVEVVDQIKVVQWKGGKASNVMIPISTKGDAMWNLAVGFGVMKNTNWASSYSVQFINNAGQVIDETRRIPDSEFKRLLANQLPLTGCGISGYESPSKWEYHPNFSFTVYDRYKK